MDGVPTRSPTLAFVPVGLDLRCGAVVAVGE